ncbi:MAG: hypothetical protein COA53_06510 [Rhodobacteraceae bacterium]|nr:MAG: hypothetical protein COA53_06510 [Paracoccaceae bacterium]
MNNQPRRLHLNVPGVERVPNALRLLKTRAALVEIMHPHWSPADDYAIMFLKADGRNFLEISESMGRSRISVEQRFHRLRAVKDIMVKLEAFGMSSDRYSLGDGR